MKKVISYLVLALFAMTINAGAQTFFATADSSPALRVYNAYTGTATIVIQGTGGTQYVATVDGLATTISAKTNIALLGAAIAAVTNTSGTANLLVDTSVSLAGDTTVTAIQAGGYTAAPNSWVSIPWDTSQCLHYDASIQRGPAFKPGTMTDVSGRWSIGGRINRINGDITGTGDVTVSVYVNGVLKYQRVQTSPIYVQPANGTNYTADASVVLHDAPDIAFGAQDSVIVRAARASTATTGNIGFTFIQN